MRSRSDAPPSHPGTKLAHPPFYPAAGLQLKVDIREDARALATI